MMEIQVWSHVDKEYLMPSSLGYKAMPREIVYPRVSIAAVFNGKQTFFGIAIQHPEDKDNKSLGHENAVQNALITPAFVLTDGKELRPHTFQEWAWALYHHVFPDLKAVSERECDILDVYLNSPCDMWIDDSEDCEDFNGREDSEDCEDFNGREDSEVCQQAGGCWSVTSPGLFDIQMPIQ